MTPARFRWGLFLVLMGILLLLYNFGVLNSNFVIDLIVLFPVVLIAVGIEKIFARTRFQFVSYLTSVGLFVGGLAIAFTSSHGGSESSFFSSTTYEMGADSSVALVKASLNLDESDLTIRDSGEDVVYAEFDRFTEKPEIDYAVANGTATIEMVGRGDGLFGGAVKIEADEEPDWFVRFSGSTPLEMECTGYESDIHLNMSTTPLRTLKVDADDSKIYLKVGDLQPVVRVAILGEDAELRLRVPRTVGLRVFGKEYGAYLGEVGMTAANTDSGFVSEGYDTLGNKIDVDLDDRLSSLSIDFF